MKGIQIGKEDIKLSLLIVYAEIQNNEPKILLKPISDYKIAGCTVNRQKLIAFLYTAVNKWNLKLKAYYDLHLHKKLNVNITVYVQAVYKEKYKTLIKWLKELNKRDIPCSKIRRLNMSKYQFFPTWSIYSMQS